MDAATSGRGRVYTRERTRPLRTNEGAASSRDGSPALPRSRAAAGPPDGCGSSTQADWGSGTSLGEEERGEDQERPRGVLRAAGSPPRRAARSPPRHAVGPLHPHAAGTPSRTLVFVVRHCVYDSLRCRGWRGVMLVYRGIKIVGKDFPLSMRGR